MNKKNLHITPPHIRFKKWTGKKYAVLMSLKSIVSIAFLSVSIADKLTQKKGLSLTESLFNEIEAKFTAIKFRELLNKNTFNSLSENSDNIANIRSSSYI